MIEISYKLVGTGWAGCSVTSENKQVTITASYLSDALGALSEAVLTMLTGANEARVSFDEEPGEYRWVLTRQNTPSNNQIHLRIGPGVCREGHEYDERLPTAAMRTA